MINPADFTILVVDDEPELVDLLSEDLKDEGYKTETAHSGNEAFKIVCSKKIDLVLSDVKMADGDGIELLDMIKKRDPRTPFLLFISGFSDLTNIEAYDQGADGVFSKPVNTPKLMEAIKHRLTADLKSFSRNHERFDEKFSIDLKFENLNTAVTTNCLNIGRGGMFVKLDKLDAVNENEVVSFVINFSTGDIPSIKGTGIVRWKRTVVENNLALGLGIEFDSFEGSSLDKLVDLVNGLITKSFIPKG